jgi:hypothetical protein
MVHVLKVERKSLMSLDGEEKRKSRANCEIECDWQSLGVIEA